MLSPLSHRVSLNWTADHFPLCVSCVCFCFVCVFCVFCFVFCVSEGIVTAAGLCTGPHTSSLLWPPFNGGYLYALIS